MKVLISAYACEPDKGSEPGVGWNWVRAAAVEHEVCVLTRTNNQQSLEDALAHNPVPSLRLVYMDLPHWLRFWKRGRYGVRVYYAIWQMAAARNARRLHAEHRFDVVHHVTFANIWFPALVCLVPAPFVLGPVSGGQSVPLRLYPTLGVTASAVELLSRVGRCLSRINPLVRLTWNRASVILVNNEETRAALPRKHRLKARLRTNASISEWLPPAHTRDQVGTGKPPTAIYAGRLNAFKAVSLAIEAIRLAPDWHLIIVGNGREATRLRRLSEQRSLRGRVTFIDWLPREKLAATIASADAFLLTSLKEGASLVAVEAQALQVPVIALAQGGPGQLACAPNAQFLLVPVGSPNVCIQGFANALERVRVAQPPTAWPDFGLRGVARDVDRIYRDAAGVRESTSIGQLT